MVVVVVVVLVVVVAVAVAVAVAVVVVVVMVGDQTTLQINVLVGQLLLLNIHCHVRRVDSILLDTTKYVTYLQI